MSKNIQIPYVIKEYTNVFFIYKPPYWNCVTGYDYNKLKNEKNIMLNWIRDNIKVSDDINMVY